MLITENLTVIRRDNNVQVKYYDNDNNSYIAHFNIIEGKPIFTYGIFADEFGASEYTDAVEFNLSAHLFEAEVRRLLIAGRI